MCSIGEDDFGDEGGEHSMPESKPDNPEIVGSVCKKCNIPAVVKLNFKEPQCQDCFLYYVRHKFRANLGSTKILPKDCRVLSVFDGFAGSVCLLDLVTYSLHQEKHKKLRFDHNILFVDDLFLQDEKDLPEKRKKIAGILNQFSETFLYVSLANDGRHPGVGFPPHWRDEKSETKEEEVFKQLRSSFSSETAWEDFILQRRKNIIRNVSSNRKFTHVFLPEITTDLATSVLSNVLLGRGASVALDVGFIDDRVAEVKLLRPIRDLTHQEVENFIRVRKLQCLSPPARDPSKSIQCLTEKFVQDLQGNFSSTVATVFRTGDKLAPKQLDNGTCDFCQSSIDGSRSKTLAAVEFSRVVSNSELNDFPAVDESSDLSKYCYSCRKILLDCPGIEHFLIK
ncbi:Cytoplasmic tRNA 2-thiolation protein 2 [Sergentomyia squamirostris]